MASASEGAISQSKLYKVPVCRCSEQTAKVPIPERRENTRAEPVLSWVTTKDAFWFVMKKGGMGQRIRQTS